MTDTRTTTEAARRDEYARAIYGAQHPDHGTAWLTTVDGTPNVASYAAADAILALQNPKPAVAAKTGDGNGICENCGTTLRWRYGIGWTHLLTVSIYCPAASLPDDQEPLTARP